LTTTTVDLVTRYIMIRCNFVSSKINITKKRKV
jgi:hypothetical protein